MKQAKMVFMFSMLMGVGSICFGAGAVFEQPISTQGVAGCKAISNSAWTVIPTSSDASRVGIYVTVTATAAASMAGHLATSAGTSLGTTVLPIIFKPGITQYHGLSGASQLYLLSLSGVTTETACFQEVRQ